MRISDWSSDVCSSDLRYQGGVARILSRPLRWLAIFIALVGLTVILFSRLLGGFLPQEDQGTVITVVQAPPGATRERTEEAVRQVKEFYNQQDIVTSVFVSSEEQTSELQSLLRNQYSVLFLNKNKEINTT